MESRQEGLAPSFSRSGEIGRNRYGFPCVPLSSSVPPFPGRSARKEHDFLSSSSGPDLCDVGGQISKSPLGKRGAGGTPRSSFGTQPPVRDNRLEVSGAGPQKEPVRDNRLEVSCTGAAFPRSSRLRRITSPQRQAGSLDSSQNETWQTGTSLRALTSGGLFTLKRSPTPDRHGAGGQEVGQTRLDEAGR